VINKAGVERQRCSGRSHRDKGKGVVFGWPRVLECNQRVTSEPIPAALTHSGAKNRADDRAQTHLPPSDPMITSESRG
jgi:hypothetical protein